MPYIRRLGVVEANRIELFEPAWVGRIRFGRDHSIDTGGVGSVWTVRMKYQLNDANQLRCRMVVGSTFLFSPLLS